MKTNRITLTVLSFVLFVGMACSILPAQINSVVQTSSVPPEATPYLQVTSDASSGRVSTQYWKGTFPDSFWMLNCQGVPDIEISGISWMILTFDKISGDITSFHFGMSEVTWKNGSGAGFNYPSDNYASDFPREELGLTGPVWSLMGSDTHNEINMGVQQFTFVIPGYERWVFNYTTDQMTGGVTPLDTKCMGRQSDTNAFHLYRQ